MNEIEPSRDAELWKRYEPEITLAEALLGPFGAITRYVRERVLATLGYADRYGADVEHLTAAINESPALAALVVNALEAARRTRLDAKARAFGKAIARGVEADDAAIDMQMLVVRLIDGLEMPHIEALELMRPGPYPVDSYAAVKSRLGPIVSSPVIERLCREGLVKAQHTHQDPYAGPDEGMLTQFGELVRDYLIDH